MITFVEQVSVKNWVLAQTIKERMRIKLYKYFQRSSLLRIQSLIKSWQISKNRNSLNGATVNITYIKKTPKLFVSTREIHQDGLT